jgi:hypothetical protein
LLFLEKFVLGENDDEEINNFEQESISSAGLGIEYLNNNAFGASLYWAESLDDVQDFQNGNLQDDGVHISVFYTRAL